jgi:two-component system OmpR family response regulator
MTDAKPRLLVIEDERLIRNALVRKLVNSGFDVDEAEDGAKGLEKLHAGRYDLVLLDVFMPVMDGIALLHRLRDEGGATSPIVLMTNLADHDTRVVEAKALGIVGVIIKAESGIGRIAELIKAKIDEVKGGGR